MQKSLSNSFMLAFCRGLCSLSTSGLIIDYFNNRLIDYVRLIVAALAVSYSPFCHFFFVAKAAGLEDKNELKKAVKSLKVLDTKAAQNLCK